MKIEFRNTWWFEWILECENCKNKLYIPMWFGSLKKAKKEKCIKCGK